MHRILRLEMNIIVNLSEPSPPEEDEETEKVDQGGPG